MTEQESPKRQLERALGIRRGSRAPGAIARFHRFRCGDRVALKCDPRQTGRVCFTDNSMVRVQWDGSGWKSDHHHPELEKE